MITESQQKTLSELQEFYQKINSLETPPSSLMEEIGEEVNKATAKKIKREASIKASHSMAFELMTKYADDVVRPVVRKFIHDFNVSVREDGSLRIWANGYYQNFTIEAAHNYDKTETEYSKSAFAGFKADYRTFTMDLSDFNDALKKFVIDTAKAVGNLY